MGDDRPTAYARLRERIDGLPREPGVYLMKDRRGAVFYVGKAVDLRARVRSYFRGSDTRAFVALLDEILADLEVVVVRSEHEAFVTENQLIKQYRPRYNVQLNDDKSYLVLRLDLTGLAAARKGQQVPLARAFPRLEVTRRVRKDGARYFGPYVGASRLRETLRLINHHFGLRTCGDRTMQARRRPCLMHQMGRCLGPCVLPVGAAGYGQRVDDVVLFLTGRHGELSAALTQRMQQASQALEYEAAAHLRDQLRAVERVVSMAGVAGQKLVDRDLWGFARDGRLLHAVMLPVRNGMFAAATPYAFGDQLAPDDELLASLLGQHYQQVTDAELPDEVLVPFAPADGEALGAWLSARRKTASASGRWTVAVRTPARGEAHSQLAVAERNARAALDEAQRSRDERAANLERLQQRLHLATLPRTIECFDVSTTQGQSAVASKVQFVDGLPHKAGYRHYVIRSVAGQDDFAMLYEALTRRLQRGRDEGDLPDLLLVDGGKGQLAVAEAVCRDLRLEGLALAGIAKARVIPATRSTTSSAGWVKPSGLAPGGEGLPDSPSENEVGHSDERIFLPGRKDPIPLRPHSAERALVERIRDEAHRFAIEHHRKRRAQRALHSPLDDVPGVGPALRGRLLRHFGSLRALREASVTDIARVKGVSAELAGSIQELLNRAPAAD